MTEAEWRELERVRKDLQEADDIGFGELKLDRESVAVLSKCIALAFAIRALMPKED